MRIYRIDRREEIKTSFSQRQNESKRASGVEEKRVMENAQDEGEKK